MLSHVKRMRRVAERADVCYYEEAFVYVQRDINAEERCGCPGGRPQTDCSRATAGAVMRSGD